jgi:hypothetical protein
MRRKTQEDFRNGNRQGFGQAWGPWRDWRGASQAKTPNRKSSWLRPGSRTVGTPVRRKSQEEPKAEPGAGLGQVRNREDTGAAQAEPRTSKRKLSRLRSRQGPRRTGKAQAGTASGRDPGAASAASGDRPKSAMRFASNEVCLMARFRSRPTFRASARSGGFGRDRKRACLRTVRHSSRGMGAMPSRLFHS